MLVPDLLQVRSLSSRGLQEILQRLLRKAPPPRSELPSSQAQEASTGANTLEVPFPARSISLSTLRFQLLGVSIITNLPPLACLRNSTLIFQLCIALT